MDDGVQLDHPDLNIAAAKDFTGSGGGGGPVTESDNHGTAVAGCIAASANGRGSVGVAPGVRIAAAKVATQGIGSQPVSFDSAIIAALDWGRQIGARISNLSWKGGSPSGCKEDPGAVERKTAGDFRKEIIVADLDRNGAEISLENRVIRPWSNAQAPFFAG